MRKLAFVLVVLAASSHAVTRYVAPNGGNVAPYTTWANAATSIQTALNASTSGDTVIVSNGTYYISAELVVASGISLISLAGPDKTIINPNKQSRGFNLGSATCFISGFTITNARAIGDTGAAFNASPGNAPVVSNCVAMGNLADVHAGGSSYGRYFNCIFKNNYAGHTGGGVNRGLYYNCLIANNAAASSAGGAAYATLENCTVVSNNNGGTLACYLTNSIAYFNQGWNYTDGANPGYYAYSCLYPITSGPGNISNDPQFVSHQAGDYHLKGTSPCINAGTNMPWMVGASDLAGMPRIIGSRVDMGAFEFVSLHLKITNTVGWVSYDTIEMTLAGTSFGATGYMWVSNAANAQVLSFPASQAWQSAPVSLAVGTNVICVCVTNNAGDMAVATTLIGRSQANDLANGLVAYFPFNGNARDLSVYRCDGTVYQAVLTTDRFGNANSSYSFDGVNDYISFSNLGIKTLQANSVAVWVYRRGSGQDSGRLLMNGTVNTGLTVSQDAYTQNVLYRLGNSWANTLVTDNAPLTNVWKLVVCTYDGAYQRIYVNAQLVSERPETISVPNGSGNLGYMGGDTHQCTLDGALDDVRVYNRALTPWEIQALYVEQYPSLTITTTTSWVSYDIAAITLAGTVNGATGYMWVSNAANGQVQTFAGTTAWQSPAVMLAVGANTISVYATNGFGAITNASIVITRGPAGTGTPFVDVTNADRWVSYDVTSGSIAGTNNANIIGWLRWSNTLNGASAAVPVSSFQYQVSSISLSVGANTITVSGTNAFGVSSSDSVTITRGPAGTGVPFLDVTNASRGVTHDVTTGTIGGTNNINVVGTMAWVNSLGGSGSIAAGTQWTISGIPLSVGNNVITVSGTNAFGAVSSDVVTITRGPAGTGVPSVDVTNVDTWVTYDTTAWSVAGTNNMNVVGRMTVLNTSFGGAEQDFAAALNWTAPPAALGVGANTLLVAGTNAFGVQANDTVTITRGPAGTGAPFTAITSGYRWVSYDVTDASVAGTNNLNVVGDMRVLNTTVGGAATPFAAALTWVAPAVPLAVGTNSIMIFGTNAFGATTLDSAIIERGPAGTGVPFLDVTTTPANVSYDITSYTIAGTNNLNVVGAIRWSNTATQATGTLPAALTWNADEMTLAVGGNPVIIRGTNTFGAISSDSVTITRGPAGTGTPFVDITTADAILPYDVTSYTVNGTNNLNVVGTMNWSNVLNASAGTLPAVLDWVTTQLPLGVGANVVTVRGTNAYGVTTSDQVTLLRGAAGTGTPFVDVTTADAVVPHTTTSCTVSGTNNLNVVGQMQWANPRSTSVGTLAAQLGWSIADIPLGVGSNLITVIGTNAFGVASADNVLIVRGAPGTGAPFVDITNTPAVLAYELTSCAVAGTNNVEVVGTLVWTNLLNGSTATLPASLGWTIAAVPLAVGVNPVIVAGTNSAGAVHWDAVDISRRPATPTGLTASDGTAIEKVVLAWNRVAGVQSYAVWRAMTNDISLAVLLEAACPTNAYEDTSGLEGRTYFYWVLARQNGADSEPSVPDSGYRQLEASADIHATLGVYSNAVEITWTGVAGARDYRLLRGQSGNITMADELAAHVASTSFVDTNLTPGVVHYYWVRGERDAAAGAWLGPAPGYALLVANFSDRIHWGSRDTSKADTLIAKLLPSSWSPLLNEGWRIGIINAQTGLLVSGPFDMMTKNGRQWTYRSKTATVIYTERFYKRKNTFKARLVFKFTGTMPTKPGVYLDPPATK